MDEKEIENLKSAINQLGRAVEIQETINYNLKEIVTGECMPKEDKTIKEDWNIDLLVLNKLANRVADLSNFNRSLVFDIRT